MKSGENKETPRVKLDHETPFWIRESESIFFITVCCSERGTNSLANDSMAPELIDTVRHRNDNGIWWCSAFIVMPDHIHALIQFSGSDEMQPAIRKWKSWTAKSLGIEWQRDWFDHRLRGDENWRKKAEYIWNNPVRAGLVKEAEDWPYSFFEYR